MANVLRWQISMSSQARRSHPAPKALETNELQSLGATVLDQLATYLSEGREGRHRVVSYETIDEISERLQLRRLMTEGDMDEATLLTFIEQYCRGSASHNHPGYMAHQIAAPDVPSMIADMIQGVTNNIPLIHELAPVGSAIDRAVYRWMLEKVGWTGTGSGTLTSGGTLGNLTALLAARSHAAPESWRNGNPEGLVLLSAETSHYSLRKALAVMGLGESAHVALPVDHLGRIDVARVPTVLRRLRANRQKPFALVANACATATGLHDDIATLANLCAADGVWLHVDGAHGASGLLSVKHRWRFDGLELASSLTWDTHKMLRTSALCTGVMVRDADALNRLFQQDASYLFHEAALGADMGQRTFETSKPPLGLRLFLNLAYRGEGALARFVDDQYGKADLLWRLLQDTDDFECPYRPETNILCFRYRSDPDRQLWIRDQLRLQGDYYLSSAKVSGVTYLRAAIMSPSTDEAALRDLIAAIRRVTQSA